MLAATTRTLGEKKIDVLHLMSYFIILYLTHLEAPFNFSENENKLFKA